MTVTIKVQLDEDLAKRFRKKTLETYGSKKGATQKALEELILRFSESGEADWKSLRGVLKTKKRITSVQLQHHLMKS